MYTLISIMNNSAFNFLDCFCCCVIEQSIASEAMRNSVSIHHISHIRRALVMRPIQMSHSKEVLIAENHAICNNWRANSQFQLLIWKYQNAFRSDIQNTDGMDSSCQEGHVMHMHKRSHTPIRTGTSIRTIIAKRNHARMQTTQMLIAI